MHDVPSNPYATVADLAAAKRLAAQPLRPFRANIGGPFQRLRHFDPGDPGERALQAAADRIARDLRDAEALRARAASFRTRSGTYR